jgi:hypothetical protein
VTESMRDLEKRTERAYGDVSSWRVDAKMNEDEWRRLRLLSVIVTILLVPVIVCVGVFAPWWAFLAPIITWGILAIIVVRRLYWLKSVEAPKLERQYHRALTRATEALQAQEDRKRLGLFEPEEYAKLEAEAQQEKAAFATQEEERKRKEYADQLWDEAFNTTLSRTTIYSWL